MELWEDELITYGCENETLVIDNTKGVVSVNYKCLDDGTYDAPKGKEMGDPWPECTLKPVDPCNCFGNLFYSFMNCFNLVLIFQLSLMPLFCLLANLTGISSTKKSSKTLPRRTLIH